MEYIEIFKEWVITLGEKHGVDPLILGSLYLISKVCFFTSLGWVFKNIRTKKSVITPLLIACVFFSIPYTYIIIAGRNISWWVYVFIIFMFFYGIYSLWKKVTVKPKV
ncbi:hypothetical protein GCM10027049_06490 [Mucilaginibacter puniceus]